MLALRLAFKNIMGAGLRTALNVAVLSFAFVVMVLFNGFLDGWDRQARTDSINWEFGKGYLVHDEYDRFDPFTIQDGHGVLAKENTKGLIPVLYRQASIYPDGRMLSVVLKGIESDQELLELPTGTLKNSDAEIPVLIGKRMAKAAKVKKGDKVLIRWRDKNGTFDATDATIVDIFDSNVPTIDNGQIWIDIEKLWQMTGLKNHATIHIANEHYKPQRVSGWHFQNQDVLLKEFDDMIAAKKVSSSIMYIMLLAIALLAMFDTQVLSVFRRQREIGTYISLGMTRLQVMWLFTFEGSMNSILGVLAGCLYGLPIFLYLSNVGISLGMGDIGDEMGISIAETIFPVFGLGLILTTTAAVVISATIVSFLPARKIAKMDAVDALKGKLQ